MKMPVFALVALLLAGCARGPEPIQLGVEECAHCRMTISDRRFASQLVTDRGMAYKFDSIECMASFVGEGTVPPDEVHSLWVADFDAEDGWLRADGASFVTEAAVRSPMGASLTAHATHESARAFHQEFGGRMIEWAEVLELPAAGGHDHGSDAPSPCSMGRGTDEEVDEDAEPVITPCSM